MKIPEFSIRRQEGAWTLTLGRVEASLYDDQHLFVHILPPKSEG